MAFSSFTGPPPDASSSESPGLSTTDAPSRGLKMVLAERIRAGIVSRKYKPGERMNESRLARDFGVSRIPVREALMQLYEQGLLMNHPHRGMFVNMLSEADTQKINSVRIVLEAEAIKLCRARFSRRDEEHFEALVSTMEEWRAGSDLDAAALDLEFHRMIWQCAGNEYLQKTLMSLVPVLMAHHALDNISQDVVRWRLNHHRALLEVIQGKSSMSPEHAIVIHLRMAYSDPEKYSSFAIEDPADPPERPAR